MSVVNTNVNASIAQAALTKNDRELSAAMQQLSTGRKINSARIQTLSVIIRCSRAAHETRSF